jgi:hypothetical protein
MSMVRIGTLEFRNVNWNYNLMAALIAHRYRVASQGRGVRHRAFIKYGLLTFLVVPLSSWFILRHKVAMTAQP